MPLSMNLTSILTTGSMVEHASTTSLLVTLVIDSIGIFLSILAFISMITVQNLKSTFSGTLLSFSVANLLGGLLLLWSSISEILLIEITGINPTTVVSMAISIMLSISHLMCLALAEYIQVSSRFKYVTKSFRPLLCIVWFLAICSCSVMFFLDVKTCEVISLSLILVFWLGFIAFYMTTMKFYRNHNRQIAQYSRSHIRNAKTFREIKFPRVIIVVYFLCALPWAIKEANYVQSGMAHGDSTSYYFIVIYSLNFHVFSLICIYLRLRNKEKNLLINKTYSTEKFSAKNSVVVNEYFTERLDTYTRTSSELVTFNSNDHAVE